MDKLTDEAWSNITDNLQEFLTEEQVLLVQEVLRMFTTAA